MFIELNGSFTPDELAHELSYVIQCLKDSGIEFVVKPKLQLMAFSKGSEIHPQHKNGRHPGLVIARMKSSDGLRNTQTRYAFWFQPGDTQVQQFDCLDRVGKVWDRALRTLGNEQDANAFMKTMIEGTGVPKDLAAASDFGANIVLSVLKAIAPSRAKKVSAETKRLRTRVPDGNTGDGKIVQASGDQQVGK